MPKALTTRQIEYRNYLSSDNWRELRNRKVAKGLRKTCSGCHLIKTLQAHHVLYRGDPTESKTCDLMWLCGDCHALLHELIGLQFPESIRKGRAPANLRNLTKMLLHAELRARGQYVHKGQISWRQVNVVELLRGVLKPAAMCLTTPTQDSSAPVPRAPHH